MKIISVKASNFGSYKELEFSNEALSLVYGKTGVGKSTLPDAVAWCLFGVTAKGMAADDVKSWQSEGITEVKVELDNTIVVRSRGKGANDLYFIQTDAADINLPSRGKDITETQKLLEQRLGVSADLFIAASYYHEFSPTGAFFTAKAKDRRDLFEKLASLELPKKLAEKTSAKRKVVKNNIDKDEIDQAGLKAKVAQIEIAILDNDRMSAVHLKNKAEKILDLEFKSKNYDKNREAKLERILGRLEAIDAKVLPDDYFNELLAAADHEQNSAERCEACGSPMPHNDHLSLDRSTIYKEKSKNALLLAEQNSLIDQLENAQNEVNTFQYQIDQLQAEPNPYDGQEVKLIERLTSVETYLEGVTARLASMGANLSALDALYDLISTLRGELLKTAVMRIQDDTNKLLETYFDAELRVAFSLEGSDSLTVEIQKSGYDCNYKQLSKGQRGLLKLCFSVSVMGLASERAGVHFEDLYFDESLDGLDESLKLKAFNLLQHLATKHNSVLVIDHAEAFQNLFDKRYLVTMEGDYSKIEEQNGQ